MYVNKFNLLENQQQLPDQCLRATAAIAVVRLSHRNSVCPSLRLSHGWISQRRCKL